MSYWSVGLPQDPGDSTSNMEQQSSPGEEMGAKASLVDGMGPGSSLAPSLTLENIQTAYEDGEESARELIQQACCVECSAGTPRIDG
ncbi:leucine-rich repeat serine/threonine-protein kinase 1, partial [Lates japonicus]